MVDLRSLFYFSKLPKLNNKGKCLYGFQIFANEACYQHFYTKNKKLYQIWIRELEKQMIQLDFENEFSIENKIDVGGFSTVNHIIRKDSKKSFAGKFISKQKMLQIPFLKGFIKNEVQVLISIQKCENLNQLYGIYETETDFVLVLEYLKGGTLYQKLKEHKNYNEEIAFQIFYQLINGLFQLHKRKIVHRDIKLENIIFQENSYNLQICDFGLSGVLIQKKNFQLFENCGTPGYMAPEMMDNSGKIGYNEKVDVFSVGIILYMLINYHPPFYGETTKEIVSSTKDKKIKFRAMIWKDKSKSLIKLIKSMTAKDPQSRYNLEQVLKSQWVQNQLIKFKQSKEKDLNPYIRQLNIPIYSSKTVLKIPNIKCQNVQEQKTSSQNNLNNQENNRVRIDSATIQDEIGNEQEGNDIQTKMQYLQKIFKILDNNECEGARKNIKFQRSISDQTDLNKLQCLTNQRYLSEKYKIRGESQRVESQLDLNYSLQDIQFSPNSQLRSIFYQNQKQFNNDSFISLNPSNLSNSLSSQANNILIKNCLKNSVQSEQIENNEITNFSLQNSNRQSQTINLNPNNQLVQKKNKTELIQNQQNQLTPPNFYKYVEINRKELNQSNDLYNKQQSLETNKAKNIQKTQNINLIKSMENIISQQDEMDLEEDPSPVNDFMKQINKQIFFPKINLKNSLK